VAWSRRGTGMTMALTVPANATATVRLPSASPGTVREGGGAAALASGVTVVSTADGVAALAVDSGTYRFSSS
jgi:alpha-L-rhamnosidase